MGIVLNFTMFLCTIVNSALTTTIVGVLKGVVSTVSIMIHDFILLVWKSKKHNEVVYVGPKFVLSF